MSDRPTVTLAIVPDSGRASRAGRYPDLEAMLIDRDNLVVLGKGLSHTPSLWRVRDGARFVHPERVPRLGEIIVVVREHALCSKGLIDELCATLEDPTIGAVGPRTNHADGEELLVGVPYRSYEPEVRAQYLLTVAETDGPRYRRAHRLSGPCLATRRSLIEDLGGLEQLVRRGLDPTVLALLAAETTSLAIAERAYIHDPGGAIERPARAPRPHLISACLIVRDEEANLERCLSSLTGVVDEIVVYDTGSVDNTAELAATLGAHVVRGYWDDDFARARNAALESCTGEWVLWIDADEVLVCDANELRSDLARMSAVTEGLFVTIDDLRGTDAATTLAHPACKLFRRSEGHWSGRIHEQVVARTGTRELALTPTLSARMTHWGYVQSAMNERDKGARNLRSAFGDLAGDSDLDLGERLTSLGRSYVLSWRLDVGLEIIRAAIELTEQDSTERLARRGLIEALLMADRAEEALEEVHRLAERSTVPTLARMLEGNALNALGRYEEALEAFSLVTDSVDDDGYAYSSNVVASPKAQALFKLGRTDEAATVLLNTLTETGGLDAHLGLLVECLDDAGRSLEEITRLIPADRYRAFLPQLLQIVPEVADRVLEAFASATPDNLAVLATAASAAPRLSIERQLAWSARLRSVGLEASCPLLTTTTESGTDPVTRVVAAATCLAAFGDPRAELALSSSALLLSSDEQSAVLAALCVLGPAIAERIASLEHRVHEPGPRAPHGPSRRVLIVGRVALELRAYALAARLAHFGHEVTLIQPQPAAPAEDLLGPLGVTVRGYVPGGNWEQAALSFVAHCYARQEIDVVICTRRAGALANRIGELVPLATVLLESETTTSLMPMRISEGIDELYGFLEPVAQAHRSGVALIVDLESDPEIGHATVERLGTAIAASGEPIVVIGDDRDRQTASVLRGALVAGPLADPTPWIRAAKGIVIATESETTLWQELAEHCDTPVLALADTDPALLTARLAGHAEPERSRISVNEEEALEGDPLAGFIVPPLPRSRYPQGREVGLVGNVYGYDSLATVNRELVRRLVLDDEFALRVATPEVGVPAADAVRALRGVDVTRGPLRGHVNLEIRHQWPPDFSPSTAERLVLIQPWEFGGLPAEWIGPLRDIVDELWVPTNWIRQCAIDSGVSEERVAVVPNGVDTAMFTPEGSRARLRTKARTRLLFVGGLIERKGIDAAVETYLATFHGRDDVCLVIKPFGSSTLYRDSTLEPVIRRIAETCHPEIEIVDEHLSTAAMAELYRSCDVLVHPYRGEGFGLPVAEAMACGLPVVVSEGGACDDFCDDEVGWMVSAKHMPIATEQWTPSAPGARMLEPSRAALAEAMRAAVDNPDERKRRGAAARDRIVSRFTWDAAAEVAAERIDHLLGDAPHAMHASRELEFPTDDDVVLTARAS